MTSDLKISDIEHRPLKSWGNSSKTHESVQEKAFEYTYMPIKSAYVPALIMLFFACAPTALFIALLIIGEPGLPVFVFAIPLLFSVLFLALTYLMWKKIGGKKTISISDGFYWQGNTRPNFAETKNNTNHWVLLDEVQAIQIIEKPIHKKHYTVSSYEFNLVLKSGHRVNVLDHADGEGIIKDANEIARHLRIPVYQHAV